MLYLPYQPRDSVRSPMEARTDDSVFPAAPGGSHAANQIGRVRCLPYVDGAHSHRLSAAAAENQHEMISVQHAKPGRPHLEFRRAIGEMVPTGWLADGFAVKEELRTAGCMRRRRNPQETVFVKAVKVGCWWRFHAHVRHRSRVIAIARRTRVLIVSVPVVQRTAIPRLRKTKASEVVFENVHFDEALIALRLAGPLLGRERRQMLDRHCPERWPALLRRIARSRGIEPELRLDIRAATKCDPYPARAVLCRGGCRDAVIGAAAVAQH